MPFTARSRDQAVRPSRWPVKNSAALSSFLASHLMNGPSLYIFSCSMASRTLVGGAAPSSARTVSSSLPYPRAITTPSKTAISPSGFKASQAFLPAVQFLA